MQTRFVQGLTFTPEVDAGNAAAAALVAQGVKTSWSLFTPAAGRSRKT